MQIRYIAERDELIITVEADSDQMSAIVDEQNCVISLAINSASNFVQEILQAGVKVPGTQPPDGMLWHDAKSRMIHSFGYDKNKHILEVVFHHIGTYRYYDVPWDIFEGLRNASSKSNYMRTMIIDLYPSEKKKS